MTSYFSDMMSLKQFFDLTMLTWMFLVSGLHVYLEGISPKFNFIKEEILAQMFSCEFCEIFKNTFFTEHLWATASNCNF